MTNEQAISILKDQIERAKSVLEIEDVQNKEQLQDIITADEMAIKALSKSETTPSRQVIEDIKADIEETIGSYVCDKEENTMKAQGMLNAMRMTFEIIDKHTETNTQL